MSLQLTEKLKIVVAYDGTAYLGWQDNGWRPPASPHSSPFIEGVLRQALETLLQHPIRLEAASRTDAGVHADGQVVTFKAMGRRKELPAFLASLNALLPKDIRALSIAVAPENFNPALDACGKEYHYRLFHGLVLPPHERWTAWHYPYPLDYEAMAAAADKLVGEHDFAAFCLNKKQSAYESTIRTLSELNVVSYGFERVLFRICGDNFLYKMARTIVGTLLGVGRKIISLDELERLLLHHDRTRAGVTAPPQGLTLFRVFYSTANQKF